MEAGVGFELDPKPYVMEGKTDVLKKTNPPSLRVFNMLLNFAGIGREVLKTFSRNGRVMSSITLLIIFLNSILIISNIVCTKVPMMDFVFKASSLDKYSPPSPEFAKLLFYMKYDLQLVTGLELIFFGAFSFTSLFFVTASITGSAVTYGKKDLSTRELISRALKSLKRPFVTWFFTKLLDLGFCLLISFLLLLLVLLLNSISIILALSAILLILAALFRTHLAVVWNLALVVSVLEEKCGLEALGKAGHLVKGSKLRGFFLNLVGGFSISMSYALATMGTTPFPANARLMIQLLFSNSIISMISMFLLISYTVLYYECKESHGEEPDTEGSTECTKVTFTDEYTPLISADAP